MEKLQRWLGYVLLIAMVINLYNIFIFVPTEKTMGIVQRIFYFHVPSAFTAFLSFFVVAIFSVAYLVKRKYWYDRVSYAAAEIGVVFTTAVLLTGPIWAKPAWNTWWSWDPRLTTTLILWFIYVAYLILRDFTGEDERGARFAAVFAIVGFVDVPIVYFSIRWWRTIHPQPVLLGGKGSGLHPKMLYTLMFSLGVFLILFIYLLAARLRMEKTRQQVLDMKRELAFQEK
ncbi:MAG: cytochrome C assembly protein [Calditrichaeota bacterium]|nr:MAG: cytochrome C assembly protein [Calditrichota bacterium]